MDGDSYAEVQDIRRRFEISAQTAKEHWRTAYEGGPVGL